MKRSEMCKSITEFIKRVEGHTYPEGISSPGEWILDHIEKAGMQPPVCGKVKQYRIPNGSVRTRMLVNEWEDETDP